MRRGKRICSQLKAVRHAIAEANNIPLEERECTHQGDCRGTCPRCEAEVRYLERELERRRNHGRAAVVVGIAMSLPLVGCNNTATHDGTAPTLPTNPAEAPIPLPQEPANEPPDAEPELLLSGIIDEVGFLVEETESGDTLPQDQSQEDDDEMIEGEPSIDYFAGMVIEDEPEYPGGEEALMQYLSDNIRYPELALQNKVQGTVYIVFTVEKDGTITDAQIKRDIGSGCGMEALRVVKSMPKWKPAKQAGVKVSTSYMLPVEFSLEE